MASARLLALAVLFCSFALAQNQAVRCSGPPIPQVDSTLLADSDPLAGMSLPLDSQRALLKPDTLLDPFGQSPDNSQNSALSDQAKRFGDIASDLASHGFDPKQFRVDLSPQGKITVETGELCYSIRSYLMARDSKDSDSTHLVGTSSCLPARRYGLKTTDPQPHVLQR